MDSRETFSNERMAQVVELLLPMLLSESDQSARRIEERSRLILQEVGRSLVGAAFSAQDRRYQKTVPCRCGGHARYCSRREAMSITVHGRVTYRRAYYVCPRCHQGQSPLDQALGLRAGSVGVALGSLLAVLGTHTAFREAARLAEALLLVRVSENTIRSQTQYYGQMQEEREVQWQQESHDSERLMTRRRTVTDAPRRLYGSLDGVIIPLKERWTELKVGCWYEACEEEERHTGREPPGQRAREISYYCDLSDADGLRPLVWTCGYQRKADRAEEVVFIADGAAWIWKLVKYHYPGAVEIVDWYHAVAYLTPIAQAIADEAERKAWLDATREHLWQGQIEDVITACQKQAQCPPAEEAAQKAITYYRNNAQRMLYAHFDAKGYLVGSGVVESACKQIGTQRLKRAGARWSLEGAQRTAKARAAWLSHDWEGLTALSHQKARAA